MTDLEAEGQSPIDVVVVEDHPAFRYALEQLIARNPKLRLVASFPDGASALAGLRDSESVVVLVDVELPKIDGLTVLRRLMTGSDRRVLVISAHTDGAIVQEALASGATGYLSKSVEVREIESAVIAAAEGRTVLCSVAQQALAERLRVEAGDGSALTERETQVLRLAASGHTRAEIGRQLHVSEATVKAHLAAAYQKLGACNRSAAILEAQRRGIISDPRQSLTA